MKITKENVTREEFASLKTKFHLDVAATSDGWALEGAYVLCTVPVNLKLRQATRFSNSGFCHLGVNFFVFCRNLKTKTDLKSLCNFQIECGISKDLMIKFLPKIKKMLFFSVFDLIFLRVFSFFSVKNMSFLV